MFIKEYNKVIWQSISYIQLLLSSLFVHGSVQIAEGTVMICHLHFVR